ncbi:hypothetical protein TWF481_009855 [Arthrobotrys musiformis]|uniref:Uncharacterized protein n=1 Tax=Arthrobotrys musiformis TaxID=47236 RepID=A0AAV9W5Z7_9PEZI
MSSYRKPPIPRRPGLHRLFERSLVCYVELGSGGDIVSVAFDPNIKASLKRVEKVTLTMKYPLMVSPGAGHCFLLNDPIFKRDPDLPDDGTGDARRISLDISAVEGNRRHQILNKVWLFSEEPRLEMITIKEFLDLVVENLREHDPSVLSSIGKLVKVRAMKPFPFLIAVYAEVFEISKAKPKKKRLRDIVKFKQISRLIN